MARANQQRGNRRSSGSRIQRGGTGRKVTPIKAKSTGAAGAGRKRLVGASSGGARQAATPNQRTTDNRPNRDGGRGGGRTAGRGRASGRGGGRGNRGGKKEDSKPAATAQELDAEMDDYWVKSGNKELASKKLDDDMDEYWSKKGGDGAVSEGAQVEDEEVVKMESSHAEA